MSKDQAARIADKAIGVFEPDTTKLAACIRRAITTAVRKERERCVQCIMPERERYFLDRTIRVAPHLVCEEIIEAINGGKRGKA